MKIITDTGALYTVAEGKAVGIEVLPLNVIINQKSYREFVDIQSDEFLRLIKEGGIPGSSQPSVGETIEHFENNPNDEILVINMADGLSGTYQSTLGAKESVKNNERIYVVNSKTLCGPQRYLVQKAISLRDSGKSIKEIVSELHQLIETEKSFLIPQDFNFLKRGGRLTPLSATIGGLLKIVPVMTKTEDARRLEKFTMKKTFKSAIKEIVKALKEHGVNEEYKIYVSHAGVLEQAKNVKAMIEEAMENVVVELLELSPAFITQGGPGCIAIQTIKM